MGRHRAIGSFVILLLIAGALWPLPAHADDTVQSLYEAAKQEGKIVFWASEDVKVNQAIAARFAQRFPGITLDAFKIEPGPVVERIVTEASAGRTSVDVIDSSLGYLPPLFDRNLIEPYAWSKVFGIPADRVLFDGKAVVNLNLDVPIVYNTGMVQEGEIKTWDDLTDAKWQGKILLEARGIAFPVLSRVWGEDKTFAYLAKLVANHPIIIKGGTPTIEALAGGQGAIAIGTYGGRVLQYQAEGAPVEWARVGPIPAMIYVAMPVKGAPHPNAAKLWTYWLTTPEAQEALYAGHRYGMLTGDQLSPHGKDIKAAGVQVVTESTDIAEMQRLLTRSGAAIGALK